METKMLALFDSLVKAQILAWNQVNASLYEVEKMSAARFLLLSSLAQNPSGIGVAEIAAAQHITVGAASKLCDRLEKDGLIRRTNSVIDQRRQIVSLTDLGHDRLLESKRLVEESTKQFFNILDDTEQEELVRMLSQLIQRENK